MSSDVYCHVCDNLGMVREETSLQWEACEKCRRDYQLAANLIRTLNAVTNCVLNNWTETYNEAYPIEVLPDFSEIADAINTWTTRVAANYRKPVPSRWSMNMVAKLNRRIVELQHDRHEHELRRDFDMSPLLTNTMERCSNAIDKLEVRIAKRAVR